MSFRLHNVTCPNSIAQPGDAYICARSDMELLEEKETVYVLRCRTCGTPNVMPKKAAENEGRHKAALMAAAREKEREEEFRRKRAYSFGGS